MNQQARKKDEQTVVCSVHSLTHFCLNQCIGPGQLAKMGTKTADICVASCAKAITERRFFVRDKWAQELNEIE